MKKLIIPIVFLGVLFAGCTDEKGTHGDGPEVPGQKLYSDVAPLTPLGVWSPTSTEASGLKGLKDFSFRLNGMAVENYNQLWHGNGNYSISPLSISVAVSALAQGVDGQAREDISRMLGLDEEETASLNNKLIRYLIRNENGVEVSLANSVWHVASFPLTADYKERMAGLFGAPANVLDLYSNACVDVINSWSADKTHDMIPQILEGIPAKDFMLANALYFSSNWFYGFSKGKTSAEVFHGSAGDADVDMMHGKSRRLYADVGGIEYVGLGLCGNFEMAVIMPAAGTDMDELGRNLGDVFSGLTEAAEVCEVDLGLPRFKDEGNTEIVEVLRMMGFPDYDMPTVSMTGRADYPLLRNAFSIKHFTAVDVNEEGARLAAVTMISSLGSPGPEEYKQVKMTVDRPFYYIFYDKDHDIILMTGRVMNL